MLIFDTQSSMNLTRWSLLVMLVCGKLVLLSICMWKTYLSSVIMFSLWSTFEVYLVDSADTISGAWGFPSWGCATTFSVESGPECHRMCQQIRCPWSAFAAASHTGLSSTSTSAPRHGSGRQRLESFIGWKYSDSHCDVSAYISESYANVSWTRTWMRSPAGSRSRSVFSHRRCY